MKNLLSAELMAKLNIPDIEEETCEVCRKKNTYKVNADGTLELTLPCDCAFQPQIAADRKKRKMRKLNYYFNQSLVNDDIKRASFESSDEIKEPQIKMSYAAGWDYADLFNLEQPKNMMLIGSTGTGKSFLAYSIARKVKEQGFTVLFIDVVELLAKFRDTYNKNNDRTESEIMQLIAEVDLLVLDDVGANKPTDWANERIYDITNKRQGKHTVYTTNLSLKELQEEQDIILKRSYSRMVNKTKIVQMYGKDRRFDF